MSDLHPDVTNLLTQFPQTRWVDAFVPDQSGYGYGKRVPIERLDAVYRNGLAMSCSAFVLDQRHHGHDSEGIGWRDGDPDMIARPVPGRLAPMPWATVPTAQLLLEARDNKGNPFWHDPRAILASIVERLREDGFHPVIACELEFYLVDSRRQEDGTFRPPTVPRTGAPMEYPVNAASLPAEDFAVFFDKVREAARLQDVSAGLVYVEYGLGQFEINLDHSSDPVRAADEAVLLKRIVRGVARSLGLDATFMAKPYGTEAGSGFHMHMSLTDADGDNLFARPGGEALLRHAIGGMKKLLPDTLSFFVPNANSFKRAGAVFAPVNLAWGEDNRTVAFRIPAGTGKARRIEHRVAGADANPYLVAAAILAAAHLGITERIDPGPPAAGHAGFRRDFDLPSDVFAATRRLEKSRLVPRYFPERYNKLFASLKRGEHMEFLEAVSGREVTFFK
jgi:glutamine synthetase